MQGLFNAPLQEENSLGVTFKSLMWEYLQAVLKIQVFFDVGPDN